MRHAEQSIKLKKRGKRGRRQRENWPEIQQTTRRIKDKGCRLKRIGMHGYLEPSLDWHSRRPIEGAS
eukprot:4344084-Pleurochrysis_carterae.AAC.3